MTNAEIASKLEAIRDGDKAAFEELYKDMQTPIFTIIHRITRDTASSEDILQEVFVKLFLSPPAPQVKKPRAYIFQMARNLAIDSARKPQHTPLDDIPEAAHEPMDSLAQRMDVSAAIDSLPAQEREIVTLHVIGGLKFREISEVMDIPSGTAKWKYQKAIHKLQNMIER